MLALDLELQLEELLRRRRGLEACAAVVEEGPGLRQRRLREVRDLLRDDGPLGADLGDGRLFFFMFFDAF